MSLPGVYFDNRPEPLPELLPRMDIAVFAGFAQRGPVNLPVVIEDPARFTDLFGPEFDLLRDARDGSAVPAHLPSAVRSFFCNGGRRCWVIRLADRPAVASLPLAGLWRARGNLLLPASAKARSGGRWGHALGSSTQLLATPSTLDAAASAWSGGAPARLQVDAGDPGRPEPGDLMRISGRTPDGRDAVVFTAIGAVAAPRGSSSALKAQVRHAWWFVRPAAASLAASGTLSLFTGARRRLQAPATALVLARVPGQVEVLLSGLLQLAPALPASAWPQTGQAVRLLTGGQTLIGMLTGVSPQPASAGAATLDIGFRASVLALLDGAVDLDRRQPMHAERLRLALGCSSAADGSRQLSGLGLAHGHARYWAALPDDDTLLTAPAGNPWFAEADAPRFPLAGPGPHVSATLPIGMPWDSAQALPALAGHADALQLDGLARWGAALFLDPLLADVGTELLLATADAARFPADPARPAHRLSGVHAALAIEEATLLAVPDALHTPWVRARAASTPAPQPSPPVPDPLSICAAAGDSFRNGLPHRLAPPQWLGAAGMAGTPAGTPSATPSATSPGSLALRWSADAAADGFELQGARRPDWQDARTLYAGTALAADINPGQDASALRYLRLRVAGPASYSDWSAARVITGAAGGGAGSGGQTSAWQRSPDGGRSSLRVQRALLRLAAARGDMVAVLGVPPSANASASASATANADTAHADDAAARRHRSALTRLAPPGGDNGVLAFSEAGVTSYGALYHPWLRTVDADGQLREQSPEGAACGVIAKRALARGAWVAPANEALADAIGLAGAAATAPATALAAQLQADGINRWQFDGRVVRGLGASTLSDDPALQALNVRRLLILLRRLALRDGQRWVFEPIGPALVRSVERGFGALMAAMFERGAFAGDRREQAWQVAVDASGDDVGRFVVELRVAPSRPLQYLVVRLVRQGEQLSALEVA